MAGIDMLSELLGQINNLLRKIISPYLQLPSILNNEIVQIPYISLIIIGGFLAALIASKITSLKTTLLILLGVTSITIISGNSYLGMMILVVGLPLITIFNLKGGGSELGGDISLEDEGGGFEEESEGESELGGNLEESGEEFGEGEGMEGSEENLDEEVEESEIENQQKSREDLTEQKNERSVPRSRNQNEREKRCPYCGTKVRWVPQYKRYYCPKCQRYV